ncbi:uncharacterized protein [Nicotiana tomentosiformis]|uniref:uncharacterized protein n=1 Tax=Nicotiana tomentosiformis TaxID=4098 RepID=UPI00388C377E
MAVESEVVEYDSIFALMEQSDDDEDDDDDDEVNFLDVQRNLKSYSPKKLRSLANVLIDAYHSLINNKNALMLELGEAEQLRDDLVVVLVDLKETTESLKKENDALTEKITNVEHERDDLVVVVVDLKETIECVKKEKEALTEKVASIEHERDDLLVVVVDMKDTIEELKGEGNNERKQPKMADQDGELSNVPGEVINMSNGKADMMSQVKDSNDNGTTESPVDIEEPGLQGEDNGTEVGGRELVPVKNLAPDSTTGELPEGTDPSTQ